MAIGLVPSLTSAPNGGTASAPAAVYDTPTMSSLAAIIAWWPIAPEWPELKTVTTPTPTRRALSIAMRISRGPRMVTRPLSAIDGGRPRRLAYRADVGPRIEAAARILLDVVLEHVGHAVRLDTPEVAGYQGIGALDGFLVGDADPLEQGRYRL